MIKTVIIPVGAQTISAWTGGSTTQLAIYPATAAYATRQFIWRLSSATVNGPDAVFSALPGFTRILMLLEGDITLNHKGHYARHLSAFEQDRFDGRWETSSVGQGIDFNLMFGDGVQGSVEALSIEAHDRRIVRNVHGTQHKAAANMTQRTAQRTQAIYVYAGCASLQVQGAALNSVPGSLFTLDEKALFLLHSSAPFAPLCIKAQAGDHQTMLIHAQIDY